MNARESVLATLRHQHSERVPGWLFFSTPQAEQELLGDLHAADGVDYQIKFAHATDGSTAAVSGNLQGHIVERDDYHEIVELDNGTRRLIVFKPEWFYETLWRPMDDTDDLEQLWLPDVNSYQTYWDQTARDVQRLQAAGLFVKGTLDGFYAGIWEHCCKIDKFLLALAEGNEFAQGLVDKWGAFKLTCAKKLIEAGVDALWWTDDLGSNTGPLMSPACYRKYFFPWHRRAADLAHQHGIIAMMHSHGNINQLLPDIVATGIDLLDPVGPSDGMNLKEVKEKYGQRLCFSGGISRFIADMSPAQLRTHVEEVYRIGSKGGGFLPCEEGGVPKNMPKEHFKHYLDIRAEMSRKYANGRLK